MTWITLTVVSYSEPDVLACEVKWTLGSTAANKANGDDRLPAEVLKILEDYAIKVLNLIRPYVWKIQQWTQDWKISILIPIAKKGSTKECLNHEARTSR